MERYTDFDYIFKTIIVGDSGVGKTCLLERFVDDRFLVDFATTIGVDFKLYVMQTDGKVIKLQIWDTAGQERFRGITNSFYRGANGILLCFDVTSARSFDNLSTWLEQIKQYAAPSTPIVLVGCKGDLGDKRQVAHSDAVDFAKQIGSAYIETSSKDNVNVHNAFEYIARTLLHDAFTKASSEVAAEGATRLSALPGPKQKKKNDDCC
eukprot:GGOE01029878.1.p1 GENE.GGOE01029878.1~~GGOE01029878.1.p1  ORF type:complete len:219 (+),score=39.08 GGOE01029878.1:36-659(+)